MPNDTFFHNDEIISVKKSFSNPSESEKFPVLTDDLFLKAITWWIENLSITTRYQIVSDYFSVMAANSEETKHGRK